MRKPVAKKKVKANNVENCGKMFDVPNSLSKITPSQPLKMRKIVAKKKVKANNVEHVAKCQLVKMLKNVTLQRRENEKSSSIAHKVVEKKPV